MQTVEAKPAFRLRGPEPERPVMMRLLACLLPAIVIFSSGHALSVQAAEPEFRFRINEDLGTLDWGNGEVNVPVVQQLMEGLTVSGPQGEPLPALASRWKRSPDGRTLVFSLNGKALWSDGEKVCARHFVDAWTRVLSKQFASPYAHYLFDIKNAVKLHAGDPVSLGARAEGCDRLIVELERPVSYFPALASHWVLAPIRLELIARFGARWTTPANLAVTGPYVLTEWARDRHFSLKRNPRYYGAAARVEHLKAVVVPDDSTALSLFRRGMLDWVRDLPFLEKDRASRLPEYRLFPSNVGYHLGFRMNDGLSRELRCRLGASLSKEDIPNILKGGETPARGIVPQGLSGYARTPSAAPPRLRDSLPSSIELHYYAKDIHVPLMEWIQEQWRSKLKLDVKLVRSEGKTYWGRLHRDAPQVFLSGITAAYAHPFAFLSEFLSQSQANWGHFNSTSYDELARKAAAADGKTRASFTRLAEEVLLDEQCAAVPLYFRKTAALVSKRWAGFHVNPMTYVYLKLISFRPEPLQAESAPTK